MIPITPQIMGPGIEEEYVDLMERIEKLEPLFSPFPPSNDTAEGRMVVQLMWLRQEIEAQRLPIPLDQKYWGHAGVPHRPTRRLLLWGGARKWARLLASCAERAC